jgi:protein SCO1/2
MSWRTYLIIILAIVISVTLVWRIRMKSQIEATPLPIYGKVPDFNLTERSGQKIGLQNLKGKIWIADFMFTSCSDVCPMMTSKMKQLQDLFSTDAGVQLVSFSVDPKKDSPAVLTAYAKGAGASDRWWFLTGDEKKIHQLAMGGFFLGVAEANDKNPILHSQKFALVDQKGQIRGFYDSDAVPFADTILNAVRKLHMDENRNGG